MASKRPHSPDLIANPFIKKKNLGWTLDDPLPLESAPALADAASISSSASSKSAEEPTSAAIESGEAHVSDHLNHFVTQLSKHILDRPPSPLLSIHDYASLYLSCSGNPNGAHFVIHQHDHPVAGTHYDLRLQINETSSVSWAIMYGLPGDPNSTRLMRNATETRIHCLWNHLIETASAETGSLLIWDTGTYSILPCQSKHAPRADPSSPSEPSSPPPLSPPSQPTLLHAAFQERKIRLRLHGTKLPDPYVLNLRLTRSEDASGRARSARTPRTRRRRRGRAARAQPPQLDPSSESDDEDDAHLVPSGQITAETTAAISAMEREIRELEDEEVRRTNAYMGATNSIGSVHQRKWFLSMDRPACGFVERKRWGRMTWEPTGTAGLSDSRLPFPFHVRGVEHERSVVTRRQGKDILRDENVTGFIPRKGWTPVLK